MGDRMDETASSSFTVPHAAKAWEHWHNLGAPKFHVAPMVDQSELPFRMLCRKYGATAAYTPMLHARLFAEGANYREEHLTSCPEDRPLFVQFCANDPDVLLRAAQHVDNGMCDYVDLNCGCPQRIAKRGNYGAFLMDDLPRIEALLNKLHTNLKTPVSVKIRIFPDLAKTIAYAKMVERAGASLVAVHGRTRDAKSPKSVRADWDAIKAVKAALEVPVLGNGNIQTLADVHRMLEYTGVDGVMSAESLLDDPALFWPQRITGSSFTHMDRFWLAREYLAMVDLHPTHIRMVRGHLHKLLGDWFQEHTDVRDEFNMHRNLDVAACKAIVEKLEAAVEAIGRDYPVPKLSERKLARLAKEAAIAQAIAEQAREENAVAALSKRGTDARATAAALGTASDEAGKERPAKQARLEAMPAA